MSGITVKELKDLLERNELDLSTRQLEVIPVKQLKEVPRATSLDLSNNTIFSIPPEFCLLTHIVRLDLSRNEIGFLPDNFGELKNLAFLDLYRNQISELPLSFGNLSKLKYLDMKHNPLDADLAKAAGEFQDHEACTKGATEAVNFMKKKAESRTQQIQRQTAEKKKPETATKMGDQNKGARHEQKKKAEEPPRSPQQPKPQPAKKEQQSVPQPHEKATPAQTPNKAAKSSSGRWFGWLTVILFLVAFGITVPVALTFARITDVCLYPETSPTAGRDVKAFCDGVTHSVRSFSLHPSVTTHYRPVISRYWKLALAELSSKANYLSANGLSLAREAFVFVASFVAVAVRPVIEFVVHFAKYFAQNCADLFRQSAKQAADYVGAVDTDSLYEGLWTTSNAAWQTTKKASLQFGSNAAYYTDIFVKWAYKSLSSAGDTISAAVADPQGAVNRIRASVGV